MIIKKTFFKSETAEIFGMHAIFDSISLCINLIIFEIKKYKCTCTIFFSQTKVIMKEKLITVLCVHIESSFLWAAVLLNKNRCVSYKQNISLIFCVKWIPCQAVTSVLCLLYRPETVHCSAKNVYTSEITIFTL